MTQIITLDKIAAAAILNQQKMRKCPFMITSNWRGKRKIFSLVAIIFFCTLSVFTADVSDLREELELISCPDSGMDHNLTAGVVNGVAVEPELICMVCSHQSEASVQVVSMGRLSKDFRAPPSFSPLS
jgi:hypothetical protein